MTLRQRESRGGMVGEGPRGPTLGRVASTARGYRKPGRVCCVRRVSGLLPGGQMASGISALAQLGRQVVIVVDMAGFARHIGVAGGERERSGMHKAGVG